jgi:hypothetical protein
MRNRIGVLPRLHVQRSLNCWAESASKIKHAIIRLLPHVPWLRHLIVARQLSLLQLLTNIHWLRELNERLRLQMRCHVLRMISLRLHRARLLLFSRRVKLGAHVIGIAFQGVTAAPCVVFLITCDLLLMLLLVLRR